MTTTCLGIIRRAYLSAEGVRGVPTGDDSSLALMRLQDMILALPLFIKGVWRDVIPDSASESITAEDGDRIFAASTNTVTLPTTYVDDDDGETYKQKDLSRVQIIGTATNAGLWVYSASRGSWAQADGLELSTDSPFGEEDTPGLAAMLAVTLEGDGGGQVSPLIQAQAQAAANSFRARFRRDVVVRADEAFLRNSDMGYDNGQQPV